MSNLNSVDNILKNFENVNCGLTETAAPSKITYPFLYLNGASKTEINYLKNLPQGSVPLMAKVDNTYAMICMTTICLETIKKILQFGHDDCMLKRSKTEEESIVKLMDYVLLG